MANVELIKQLRDRTGAGIMDCKNALVACNDDLDRASDWLREKGISKAAKKADRIAAEGLAGYFYCDKCGKVSVVEVNCETDFVAKSDPFKELVNGCAEAVLKDGLKTIEEAKEATKQLFTDATVKLGEKLDFRRFDVIEKQNPTNGVGTYIHMGGTHAVAVLLEKDDPELAKGLAMHIAANNPKYVTESEISKDVLDKETAIQIEVSKNDPKLANKPAEALTKIIAGKVHKVFAEVTLSEQQYLLDMSKTVNQVLTEKGNKVLKFVHYTVGEGLEKRVDNFAEEVMSQVK